jgi:hypothetical protein
MRARRGPDVPTRVRAFVWTPLLSRGNFFEPDGVTPWAGSKM